MYLGLIAALGTVGASSKPSRSATPRPARLTQSGQTGVPQAWLPAWMQPPALNRPLQIIHGISLGDSGPAIHRYRDLGLGGVVCNVSFDLYLQSADYWKAFVQAVRSYRAAGMRVWIYDEHGYPSGSAGGLVLKQHPECEATELVYDPSLSDPFVVRPAYEFTHASNNYHAARRYINLIDDRAVASFIHLTHEAYRRHIGADFARMVDAVFTDEPSLIAVNLGAIPEPARRNVPVVDPIDPSVKPLPAVPWSYDIADRYRERFGESLLPHRRSLFVGDTPEDRKVRQQYWSLIADLVSERYFGAIQKWCAHAGIASSGHTLWEEALMHHPALEGNGLKALGRMDIPGLDTLSSDPEAVANGSWMTAALPSSAAMLNGRRRVMTEVSDFSEKMSGRGPASLADMCATAAWQAAWGVTDFTLYYSPDDRSADDYRAYCQYVGRLNAVLKPAKLDPDLLLYYPVRDLWAEYRPVAEPLSLQSQPPRAQRIVGSFMRLGQTLQRTQIPFALIDHEQLAAATVAADGTLVRGGHRFRALVLPEDVELPAPAAKVVDRFRRKGGRVLRDGEAGVHLSPAALVSAAKPPYRLTPASELIALGRFTRAGRRVLLVVNTSSKVYEGRLTVGGSEPWTWMDPATGALGAAPVGGGGQLHLALGPRQALVYVSPPASAGAPNPG